jgi:hypothetical protein
MPPKSTFLDKVQKITDGKISFGYRVYDLHIVANLTHEGDKCLGLADFDDAKISVEKNQSDSSARETLLHEMCHVMFELCGLGGEHDDPHKTVRAQPNEELVLSTSRGMMLMMALNKDLFDLFLVEAQEE